MPPAWNRAGPPTLASLWQIQLLKALAREAGWQHLAWLSGLTGARQMHQLIAYAPQNVVLFETSLGDNLLLGANLHRDEIETWLQWLGLAHLLLRRRDLSAGAAAGLAAQEATRGAL